MKTGFIKYYDNLLGDYNNEEEIVYEAKQKPESTIIEKAVKEKSRYKTYLKINPNLESSGIYVRTDITTFNHLNVIKLRTVCHSLAIQSGRYGRNKKLRKQQKEHFLLKCPMYQHIRRKYNICRTNTMAGVFAKTNIAMYVKESYTTRVLHLVAG